MNFHSLNDWEKKKAVVTAAAATVAAAMEEGILDHEGSSVSSRQSSPLDDEMEYASQLPPVNPKNQFLATPKQQNRQHKDVGMGGGGAHESETVSELVRGITEAAKTATENPNGGGSAVKRTRGRPRKYHTEAEREEAKRRYRENHKSKASGSGSGAAITGTSTGNAHDSAILASPEPKGKVVDELWEAVRKLQDEVKVLRQKLTDKEDSQSADAMVAQAQPAAKKRKGPAVDGSAGAKKKKKKAPGESTAEQGGVEG